MHLVQLLACEGANPSACASCMSLQVIFLNFYQFYGTWDLPRHTDFMSQVLGAFQPGHIATGVTAASTLESVAQGGPKVGQASATVIVTPQSAPLWSCSAGMPSCVHLALPCFVPILLF